MSPGGKLTTLAYHPTKRGHEAEELAYLSTNIGAGIYRCSSVTQSLSKVKIRGSIIPKMEL
jgi:hypothetical protein